MQIDMFINLHLEPKICRLKRFFKIRTLSLKQQFFSAKIGFQLYVVYLLKRANFGRHFYRILYIFSTLVALGRAS